MLHRSRGGSERANEHSLFPSFIFYCPCKEKDESAFIPSFLYKTTKYILTLKAEERGKEY